MTRHPELTGPACCEDKGFFWDAAIVYAPNTSWKDAPPPAFWSGPVVRVIPSIEDALRNRKE